METRQLLLTFVVLTHTFTSGIWWMAGTWMGLSSRAARYWFISSLSNGLALSLLLMPASGPPFLRILTACSLACLAAMWLRQGLKQFLKLQRSEGRQFLAGTILVTFNLAVCIPLGAQREGVLISSMFVFVVMVRTVLNTFKPLQQEFNLATARAMAVTFGAIALGAFVTGLSHMTPQWPWPWWRSSPEATNFALTFFIIVASIMISFLLGYIVIMRLVFRLEHLSQHDALTGLLNRRAIEAMLAREAQLLERFKQPFTILLIDVDHFKRVNDRLGHSAGDEVLVEVARRLKKTAREVDRVARYGGEEFCVLLPHTHHAGAMLAAERLREAICERPVMWGNVAVPVTISMGLVCAEDASEPLETLVRRADDALYQAKAGGRNQVVSANMVTTDAMPLAGSPWDTDQTKRA